MIDGEIRFDDKLHDRLQTTLRKTVLILEIVERVLLGSLQRYSGIFRVASHLIMLIIPIYICQGTEKSAKEQNIRNLTNWCSL